MNEKMNKKMHEIPNKWLSGRDHRNWLEEEYHKIFKENLYYKNKFDTISDLFHSAPVGICRISLDSGKLIVEEANLVSASILEEPINKIIGSNFAEYLSIEQE